MFRETRISILVTSSLLIQESKTVNQIIANHGIVFIVYLGNRKQSAIFGMEWEQGYISAFFQLPKVIFPKEFYFLL